MLTEKEKHTQEMYDLNPYEWLKNSGGKDRACYWETEMAEFIEYLGKSKKILELGCGPATDGKYLRLCGCENVTAVDYSSGMLKMAGAISDTSAPKPELCQMDAYNIGFKKDVFDGFWATAFFVHIADPARVLGEIHRVVKPGGYGFISVKEGEGERVDPKTGYYFHYFPADGPEKFTKILSDNKFYIVNESRKEAANYNWLTYLVQKPKLHLPV